MYVVIYLLFTCYMYNYMHLINTCFTWQVLSNVYMPNWFAKSWRQLGVYLVHKSMAMSKFGPWNEPKSVIFNGDPHWFASGLEGCLILPSGKHTKN